MSFSHIEIWNHASQTASKLQQGNQLGFLSMTDPYQLKPIPPDQLRNGSRVGVYSAIAVVVLVVVLAAGLFLVTRAPSAEPQLTWRPIPYVYPTPAERRRAEVDCIDHWMWENAVGKYSDAEAKAGVYRGTIWSGCELVRDRLATCHHEEKVRWADEVGPKWNMFNIWVEEMQFSFEHAIESPSAMKTPDWKISIFKALDGIDRISVHLQLIDAPSVVADAHGSIEHAVAAVARRDETMREAISESDPTRLKEIGDTMFSQHSAHMADADASLEAWSHRCE